MNTSKYRYELVNLALGRVIATCDTAQMIGDVVSSLDADTITVCYSMDSNNVAYPYTTFKRCDTINGVVGTWHKTLEETINHINKGA